jgi:flagellar protein FlbD
MQVIELTRLNGARLALNSDLIQSMESSPDTTLTLVNGEKLVVRETTAQIIDLTLQFRARLIAQASRACPGGIVLASSPGWRPGPSLQAVASPAGRDEEEDPPDRSGLARRGSHT